MANPAETPPHYDEDPGAVSLESTRLQDHTSYLLSAGTLSVEVTRQCNAHCAHCMRGDSQQLDMTEAVVDAIFRRREREFSGSKKEEIVYAQKLLIAGGEPSLNGRIVQYIANCMADKSDDDGFHCEAASLATNGLHFARSMVDGVSTIAKKAMSRHKSLYVSSDSFHPQPHQGVVGRYEQLDCYGGCHFEDERDLRPGEDLEPFGRAVEIYKQQGWTDKQIAEERGKSLGHLPVTVRQDPTDKNNALVFILDGLYVCANGKVCVGNGIANVEYTELDRRAIGNVLEDRTITQMLVDAGRIGEEFL
ncbi:MAG: 4Fe-4S cluster-binding domain-containing protein [Candidatus Nomurabacteria bacterium]|jgi:hypothetical protein|nr:4Fe-4S cluster-binding domain-containing protein [Candidatus Nomurabacteria bacterium]